MGEYQPDAQLIERTAHLRLGSLARQLFLEDLMLRAVHGEDTVAIVKRVSGMPLRWMTPCNNSM